MCSPLHKLMTCKKLIIPRHPKHANLPQNITPRNNKTLHLHLPRLPGPRPRLQRLLNPFSPTKQILRPRGHLSRRLPVTSPRPRLRRETRFFMEINCYIDVVFACEGGSRAVEGDVCFCGVENVEGEDVLSDGVGKVENTWEGVWFVGGGGVEGCGQGF